jgi:hypothetical protein
MNIPQRKAERHVQAFGEMSAIVLEFFEEAIATTSNRDAQYLFKTLYNRVEGDARALLEDYFLAIGATDEDRNALYHG